MDLKESENGNEFKWAAGAKKTRLKQMAAAAILCAGGISAFADGGSLFSQKANRFDSKAVDEMVSAVVWMAEAGKDGYDASEKAKFNEMKSRYDESFGEGAFKYVFTEMREYAKTPGGMELSKSAKEKGFDSLKVHAERAVKGASQKQKSLKTLGLSLGEYDYGR